MDLADSEKLLADTLAAHARSPRTQETYSLMLRLFGRYLKERQVGRSVDVVLPEDVLAYQRHLVTERKSGFSSFNQATCALRFFYRECLGRTDLLLIGLTPIAAMGSVWAWVGPTSPSL